MQEGTEKMGLSTTDQWKGGRAQRLAHACRAGITKPDTEAGAGLCGDPWGPSREDWLPSVRWAWG